jgi:hypothetical protein
MKPEEKLLQKQEQNGRMYPSLLTGLQWTGMTNQEIQNMFGKDPLN